MYRNKILIIFTFLVILLLGLMIWSSNIVAEHDAARRKEIAQETQPAGEIAVPETPQQNFVTEESDEEETEDTIEPVEDEDLDTASEDVEIKIVIDTTDLTPEITKRVNSGKSIGRNYIDKLDFSKPLILWNLSTLPLKIYIQDEDNLPSGFANGIKAAFSNWEHASNGFVTFEYVYDKNEADIVIYAPEAPANGCPGENGVERTFDIQNKKLVRANLIIPQTDCDGQAVNVTNLYTYAQHYIGHILGIEGHSDRSSDVMYPENSYENINITDIDIETLKLLYNFLPSVTNSYYTKAQISQMLKVSAIKGKKASEIQEILTKHVNSGSADESEFDVLINEAYNFYEKGDYNRAESKYKSALGKSANNLDKAYVSRCLAILYMKKNEYDDAIQYANTAAEISNTPINQYLVAYINFVSGNENAALYRLEELLKRYPKLRAAYPLAAQIYKNQKNTQKLDELIQQANAHFYNDSPVYVSE